MKRTPISPVSAKRLAVFAAAGRPVLSTFAPRTVATTRQPRKVVRRRVGATGPDAVTVRLVLARDERQCFRCGGYLWQNRGDEWSVHHRRPRAAGGSRRPDTNQPQNLILLCGSATTPGGCHQRTETARAEALANGWLIRQSDDPLQAPVLHWLHGVVRLAADGGWAS